MNSLKKPNFNLKINEIKNKEKEELNNKILKINAPNLNDFQKKLLLLSEEKSTTYQIKSGADELEKIDKKKLENWIQDKTGDINDPNISYLGKSYQVLEKENAISYTANGKNGSNKIENDKYKKNFYIDVQQINENYENLILKRMEKYNSLNIGELQKRILALREDKTTTIYLKSTEKNKNHDNSNTNINKINENTVKDNCINTDTKTDTNTENSKILIYYDENDNSYNNDKSNNSFNKTNDISNNEDIDNITIKDNSNKQKINPEKYEFNAARAEFYLKYKLFDNPINIQDKEEIKTPLKYMINEKYFGFLYPNTLETFYITESSFFLKQENDNININNNINCDKKLGLYFCDKNIEIKTNDGIITKKCSPDIFMCKECMKINKNNYHIKDNYLININGRVVKKNKGKYHCFGRFLCNNLVEDCLSKFSCKACKEIDLYSDYYN